MSTDDKNRHDQLAAEFAMGLLQGDAQKAAQKRFDEDLAFRRAVEEWQENFSPLLDEVASQQPPFRVWENVSERIASQAVAASNGPSHDLTRQLKALKAKLRFWRGLSLATASLVAIGLAAVLYLSGGALLLPQKSEQPLVAGLTATGKEPAFLAGFDPKTGGLVVQIAAKPQPQTRVAELWLIPKDGVPRSLGLLDKVGTATLKVNQKLRGLFAAGGILAVSLEPSGGSPTGKPTGPVIATGKLRAL